MSTNREKAVTICLLAIVLTAAFVAEEAGGMVFKSDKVCAHWDTWCYYHDSTYYLYYLISSGRRWEGFGVATSRDGVHWEDHGWALRASEKMVRYLGTGAVWKSPDFEESGKFICNYSEWRVEPDGKKTQNILFAWSADLIHWNKFGDSRMFRVDERFYEKYGRWDCIFSMPRPEGGYYGTWTATPKGFKGVGLGYSEDGVTWKAMEPPEVAPGVDEAGAFVKIGDRVYAMFGAGGRMLSYSANRVTGPYKLSEKNAILLEKGHTYFSRFFATPGGLLVNHHSMSGKKSGRSRITYAAPLKLVEVDKEGILRFKYWKGNDALKGQPVQVSRTSFSGVTIMSDCLDLSKGVIAEGTLRLPGKLEALRSDIVIADFEGSD